MSFRTLLHSFSGYQPLGAGAGIIVLPKLCFMPALLCLCSPFYFSQIYEVSFYSCCCSTRCSAVHKCWENVTYLQHSLQCCSQVMRIRCIFAALAAVLFTSAGNTLHICSARCSAVHKCWEHVTYLKRSLECCAVLN